MARKTLLDRSNGTVRHPRVLRGPALGPFVFQLHRPELH
jgi:hypothetical protein